MELNNLKIAKGSRHLPKRVGLGIGSGMGKTSTRGQKGQGARQGRKVPVGFEGGQLPLYRRVPKHGFNNYGRVAYYVLNLRDLETLELSEGEIIDNTLLWQYRIIKNLNQPVKLLGVGECTKAYTIHLQAFSSKAKEAVEKAGGKCEVVSLKDARIAFKAFRNAAYVTETDEVE